MKRLFITMYIICTTCGYLLAQRPISGSMNIQGSIKKEYELKEGTILKEGTPITLQFVTKLKKLEKDEVPYQAILSSDGKQFYMPLEVLKEHFQPRKMTKEQFWQFMIVDKAKYFTAEDKNRNLRREQILEAEQYIEELEKAKLFYNDDALEDYLQCLILNISPNNHLYHNSMSQPVVRVLKCAEPDIMMLSNNMLLISTGMLTTLDSEDELVALFSREVSHYLLDHALITVKKNIARARRAEFWGAIAEGVIAGTEAYLYERYDYYNPGLFFTASSTVNALINHKIDQRMGMDYLEEYEKEADRHAMLFMENEGREANALRSALHKIKVHYENNKSSNALHKYNNYGTLSDRIKELGSPTELPEDRKYLKTTMNVVNYEAAMHDYYKDYENSFKLAMKNINHSLGTADDYLFVARSLMKRNNSSENNQECMLYLDKADMISEVENLNITKMRILLLLRENEQKKAVEQIKKYQELLDIMFQEPHTEDDAKWITEEHTWAKNLLERLFIT